jgi:hypothetical protein
VWAFVGIKKNVGRGLLTPPPPAHTHRQFDFKRKRVRAGLGTTISQRFFIFPWEISSFSLGKLKIP